MAWRGSRSHFLQAHQNDAGLRELCTRRLAPQREGLGRGIEAKLGLAGKLFGLQVQEASLRSSCKALAKLLRL